MRRGQVSFHHCRTVHGSGPNHATQPRRSLAIHLRPGDDRWREHITGAGVVARHGNDRLVATVDGVPDYTDRASAHGCGRALRRSHHPANLVEQLVGDQVERLHAVLGTTHHHRSFA